VPHIADDIATHTVANLPVARIHGNVSYHPARLQSNEQLIEVQRQLPANVLRPTLEPIEFTCHIRSSPCIYPIPGCSAVAAHGSEKYRHGAGAALRGRFVPMRQTVPFRSRFPFNGQANGGRET
jgi:hypothetical protein